MYFCLWFCAPRGVQVSKRSFMCKFTLYVTNAHAGPSRAIHHVPHMAMHCAYFQLLLCVPCLSKKFYLLCFPFKLLLSNLFLCSCVLLNIHVLMTEVQKNAACELLCRVASMLASKLVHVCFASSREKEQLWNGSKQNSKNY